MAGPSRIALGIFLALAGWVLVWPGSSQAGCLGEGFKQAKWGMTFKELQEKIPGLREDFNRFEPDVTAYHSFEFPNNGFSEFRLFRGKLFYIRVKITSSEYNRQLLQSMQRCGSSISNDDEGGAQRYLWQDDKTTLALYLYPYYGELRAKSEKVAQEWIAFRKKESDVEDFLESQIKSAFTGTDLSIREREQLRQLRKSLESDTGPANPAATPDQPEPSRPIGSTETWGQGIQSPPPSSKPSSATPPTKKAEQPKTASPDDQEKDQPPAEFESLQDFLQ